MGAKNPQTPGIGARGGRDEAVESAHPLGELSLPRSVAVAGGQRERQAVLAVDGGLPAPRAALWGGASVPGCRKEWGLQELGIVRVV